jgi:hypothetical protein
MNRQLSINLLGAQTFDRSVFGKLIRWASTYGRYIMIGTEIVVLLAFISRFSLDRKITDLKDEIDQKQALIEANLDLENQVVELQDRLKNIKPLIDSQAYSFQTYKKIVTSSPPDVRFLTFDYSNNSINARVQSQTLTSFSQFIHNLESIPTLTNIELQSINRNSITGIDFTFSAKVQQ